MTKPAYCLNPAHDAKPVYSRGLCQTCYQSACRHIRAKRTTWADLEAAGKALSKQEGWRGSPGVLGETSTWLLSK